jgi:hypothetical protein
MIAGTALYVAWFALAWSSFPRTRAAAGPLAGLSRADIAAVVGLAAVVILFAGAMASTVVHQLGHLLACLAVRGKVTEFSLGGKRALRFRVRGAAVSLGLPYRGWVGFEGVPSARRRALFLVAGPLLSVTVAALLLALTLTARPSASRLVLATLTLPFALGAVLSLVPHRTRTGRLSNGAQLLELRNDGAIRADLEELTASPGAPSPPERTARLLRAFHAGNSWARWNAGVIAALLRREGRTAELAELLSGLPMPPSASTGVSRQAVHEIAWNAVATPGLPPELADRAASLVQWLLDNDDPGAEKDDLERAAWIHTVATARLRQGRFAEVEPLCADLFDAGRPDHRATALATIVLARHALGQPCEDLLAQATALAPGADLVAEARAQAG